MEEGPELTFGGPGSAASYLMAADDRIVARKDSGDLEMGRAGLIASSSGAMGKPYGT